MNSNIKVAAETVVKDCMQVRENENLLIVTDAGKRKLADDVADAIRSMGVDAVVVESVQNACIMCSSSRKIGCRLFYHIRFVLSYERTSGSK